MKQYIAGHILDNLSDVFEKKTSRHHAFRTLASWASYFEVSSRHGLEYNEVGYSPLIALLINYLQRGIPTRLNLYALEQLVGRSTLLEFEEGNETSINVGWRCSSDALAELVFRSLHLIEPRLNHLILKERYQQSWERLGSNYEEDFLFEDLPAALGDGEEPNDDYIIQFLATQRALSTIVHERVPLHHLQESVRTNFEEQRCDFSIEFPYHGENQKRGIVIEVDGPQHASDTQTYLDAERDKAVASSNWHNTLRLDTYEFGTPDFDQKIKKVLLPVLSNDFVSYSKLNYRSPLWSDVLGQEVLQLCLIPFAVARIQRMVLEAIAQKILPIGQATWKIAVLERDVPCARLALDDLERLVGSINALTKDPLTLSPIELRVFATREFEASRFQNHPTRLIEEFDGEEPFDLVIDISMLERGGSTLLHQVADSTEFICIRSVHHLSAARKTVTAEPIPFAPFCDNTNANRAWEVADFQAKESLEYLLRSAFRKRMFREGQLPIMHNALQLRSVIGLLPTGGGKSLTYQLSALLQPGICLIVDPIRSLMKDQVDGLLKHNIDTCVYINSTLQGEAKRRAMKKMAEGEVQFVFVSPERLQMEEFRDLLKYMHEKEVYFSYCVIDEVHCVSEWGHDFRTAYLRLGENAMRYCRPKGAGCVPLFGLTATASYDVLADVQRELAGNDESKRITEDAIIRSEFSKRHELQYVIEEVTFPTNAVATIWDVKKELGRRKQERVKALLHEIPFALLDYMNDPLSVFSVDAWEANENNEQRAYERMRIEQYSPDLFYMSNNAALIFCPHTRGIFGVTDKFKEERAGRALKREGYYDALGTEENIKAGFFMGSSNDAETSGKTVQEESVDNQDRFINGELNLMVATKAFGMGIDKENIRYTVHLNYPASIESFVQESGRAGRDKKIALSYILFNDQKVSVKGEALPIEHDLDSINMYFHKNSFKGVKKELAVIDELLTEVYFPDRTSELENLISRELGVDVKCHYWERGNTKRLYIELAYQESLGYLDLAALKWIASRSVNQGLSEKIFSWLVNYIKNQHLTEPAYLWIQRSDKVAGIEALLQSQEEGTPFSLVIGFSNNTKERVKTITRWLQLVVDKRFTEAVVQQMRSNCTDAEAFIEDVCDRYERFNHGRSLDFERLCRDRDHSRQAPQGTAFNGFMDLFNGYREKMDTEKAIYRLSTLGVIDDYTVNFSSRSFTLYGKRKSIAEYKETLKSYLLKYYSEKTVNVRLGGLDEIDEPTPIRQALAFLVEFVYNEIQKKRQLAIHDMKTACRLGLEKGSVELKDFIDLYFNSKYARSGYTYTNPQGEEVNASLPDLTDSGKNEDLKWVWLFTSIVEEDPKAGQIDNLKHLRGACTRMLNIQPDNYTLLLLNAFALYMLEYKNPRYLDEAETLLLNAFSNIEEKEPGWSDKRRKKLFTDFTAMLMDKNLELEKYMKMHGYSFDFDSTSIKQLLPPLQMATRMLRSLNEVLN